MLMSRIRANSSPELLPSSPDALVQRDVSNPLEGVAANVKLLLKLIQDHQDASKEADDGRKPQRIAGMLTILDDVRTRIQKSQVKGRREAELRRCNTDLRRGGSATPVKERRPPLDPTTTELEHQKLRRELLACMTARKSLEKMFSSLGKEKELIASELAKKVQEVEGIQELVSDLRAENDMLSDKVRVCAREHKVMKKVAGDAMLQERNKLLSEQLLKSLEGYRVMKRRLKEAAEEREKVQLRLAEMAEAAAVGSEKVRGLRERMANGEGINGEGMAEDLGLLEGLFSGFYKKLVLAKGSAKRSAE